jgi:hypothetical protein
MENIKIVILDPNGTSIGEIETKYHGDQLDRFLSQNRIVVISNEEPVNFVSERHRWTPKNMKND